LGEVVQRVIASIPLPQLVRGLWAPEVQLQAFLQLFTGEAQSVGQDVQRVVAQELAQLGEDAVQQPAVQVGDLGQLQVVQAELRAAGNVPHALQAEPHRRGLQQG